ncbi:MAG: metallophosphoesterase family protein [Christensenellales bacterium]
MLFTATDLHYIAPTLTDNGAFFTDLIEQGDGKAMAYSDALIEAFVAQVIAEKPDALILSGDLTFNGARASHEALSLRLARVRDAGIPVFVLPGNHDLNSSSAARFEGDGYTRVDGVTAGEFAVLYHAFGFDGALSRDADSLSYVAALSDDLRLLMLDVNTSAAPNAVLKGTLSWARRQLMQAQADGCRVVAVSHQNLIDHSGLLSSGFTIRNADALRRLYAVSPVLCNLSGHIHLQHMGQTDSGLWDIATSVAGRFAESIRCADADGGRADLPHRARPPVSTGRRRRGLSDPNLLDFAAYSADFFRACCLPSGARRHRRGRRARAAGRFLRRGQRRVFFRPHGYPRAGFRARKALAGAERLSPLYLADILSQPPVNQCELTLSL